MKTLLARIQFVLFLVVGTLAVFMFVASCQSASPAAPERPSPTTTVPLPSPTSVPPTATPVPPTATSAPPTATLVPPTATSVPPTATETVLPAFTAAPEPTPTEPAITESKNVEYGATGQGQTLDVYFPNNAEGQPPVILMLHEGGGRKEQFISWGRSFAEQGYAVVASNYRGWPNYTYPQDVSDAFCALAWIHANGAEYGFDTANVFVLGRSAGGTLAAMLGVVDNPDAYLRTCPHEIPVTDRVRGVITFTGIFDYARAAQSSSALRSYATAFLGGSQSEKPDTWAEASAITWIDGSEPAFLVLHGGSDENIPPDQSTDFAQALELAGVDVELVIVPDADHSQITGSAESVETVLLFRHRFIPPIGG